jgi:GAF domain-containing protein
MKLPVAVEKRPSPAPESYPELTIPETILETWKDVVNIMAKMLDVPAGLIMRILGEQIYVLASSKTVGNPYRSGDSEHLRGSGLYCETVVTQNRELLVPNATQDERWRHNPNVKLNMISYLGYPVHWPDGMLFGTICVLDSKTNSYSKSYKSLMAQFRDIVEIHLGTIYIEAKRRKEVEHLVRERTDSLQLAMAEQIAAKDRLIFEMDQRKKAEESLRQAQDDLARISRIMGVKERAATTAYEVTESLSGVLANGSACLRWLGGIESKSENLQEARQAVERIIRDGKRAAEEITGLRNLSKSNPGEPTAGRINEVVEAMVPSVRHELE